MHWIEAQLLQAREYAALAASRRVVESIAAEVEAAPRSCPACGQRMERQGYVVQRMETLPLGAPELYVQASPGEGLNV
jgi:transposase